MDVSFNEVVFTYPLPSLASSTAVTLSREGVIIIIHLHAAAAAVVVLSHGRAVPAFPRKSITMVQNAKMPSSLETALIKHATG